MRLKFLGMALAAVTMIWMGGCSKQPFKEVQAAPDKSVVYVYWLEAMNQENSTYDVLIGDNIVGTVHDNSYIAAEVAPGILTVTVRDSDPIKAHLKKVELQIDAVASKASYIKIDSPFRASVVNAAKGSEEIKGTELWEEFDISLNMAGDENEAAAKPVQTEPSAAEEIERLLALKEKGAITEEEYQVLKARVISR